MSEDQQQQQTPNQPQHQHQHQHHHNNQHKRRNQNQQHQHQHQNQNQNNANNQQKKIQPKKEAILDLATYLDTQIRVKFTNGRQVIGTLKGYDQLMNLVLDDVTETLRPSENEELELGEAKEKKKTRQLGLVIVRGPLLLTIAPVDGLVEIENPFLQGQQQETVF